MVFSEPKELSKMTFAEAKRVIEDKMKCDSCSRCLSHQDNWKEQHSCIGAAEYACERMYSAIEELKSQIEEFEKAKQDANQSIPNALSYEQTIDFMKSRGYTHCYMCGASLNKK